MFDAPGNGFIIAAGDDRWPALLGYGESAFVPGNIPAPLADLLRAFDAQISAGAMPAAPQAPAGPDIAPLCTTQWDQTEPYNNLTPLIDGQHALTGCVATAMAQVLKYWQSPARGSGPASYTWNGQTLAYDFATPFDYAAMTDTYGSSSTGPQKTAVAELMLACGIASHMSYSSTFSGATDLDAGAALITNFGYDRGIRLLFRDFYRIDQWNRMLYDELAAGRPVLYYGFAPAGGHAYICDGYRNSQGDPYFHINWGWGGVSDGYFLINALNPEYIGAGGSVGGFNIMQSAYFGLKPAAAAPSEIFRQLLWFGYLATEKLSYSQEATILFGASGGLMRAGAYNMSLESIRVRPAIKITPDREDCIPVYAESSAETTLAPGTATDRFKIAMPHLADGTYTVTPAYVCDGVTADMPQETQMKTIIRLTVKDNGITVETTDNSDMLVIEELKVDSPVITIGEPVKITAEGFSHNFDESTTVTPVLLDMSGYIKAEGETRNVHVSPGEFFTLTWDKPLTVLDGPLSPGTYMLTLLNSKSMAMASFIKVALVNTDTPTEFDIANLRINRQLAAEDAVTPVTGETMNVSCKTLLLSGYFDGNLAAWIYSADGTPLRPLSAETAVTLFPGESQNLSFAGTVNGLDPAMTYTLAIAVTDADGNPLAVSALYPFNAPDAAITTATADTVLPAEYFTLQGTKVAAPQPGRILLCRRGTAVSKILVR